MRFRGSRVAILFAGITLVMLTGFAGFYWIFVHTPARMIERSAEGMRQIAKQLLRDFPLHATVQHSVLVLSAPKDRADWLAAEESFLVRHEFKDSFLLSEKRFEVEAVVRVGMGFSFAGSWKIEFDDAKKVASVSLPEPQVLFVEISNLRVLRDEDGLWNRLTAQDRETALRQLEADARSHFDRPALEARATQSLRNVLQRAFAEYGYTLREEINPQPMGRP